MQFIRFLGKIKLISENKARLRGKLNVPRGRFRLTDEGEYRQARPV